VARITDDQVATVCSGENANDRVDFSASVTLAPWRKYQEWGSLAQADAVTSERRSEAVVDDVTPFDTTQPFADYGGSLGSLSLSISVIFISLQ